MHFATKQGVPETSAREIAGKILFNFNKKPSDYFSELASRYDNPEVKKKFIETAKFAKTNNIDGSYVGLYEDLKEIDRHLVSINLVELFPSITKYGIKYFSVPKGLPVEVRHQVPYQVLCSVFRHEYQHVLQQVFHPEVVEARNRLIVKTNKALKITFAASLLTSAVGWKLVVFDNQPILGWPFITSSFTVPIAAKELAISLLYRFSPLEKDARQIARGVNYEPIPGLEVTLETAGGKI